MKQSASNSPQNTSQLAGNILSQFKCTEQQSEILSACAIGGDDANRAFNQSITLKISGNLNLNLLIQTLDSLVQRHDNFRMRFDLSRNLCLIADSPKAVLSRVSLSVKEDLNVHLSELKKDFANHCFDLQNGPLYQFNLLSQLQTHYLSLTAHHVICDGWTLGLLISEIGAVYNALVHPENQLADPLSYVDFATLESSYHTSEQFISVKNFWKHLYKDFKPLPALPYSSARPSEYVYKSNHISFPLNDSSFQHLRTVSDKVGCSLLVTMCSLFEVLLYRKSGVSSFVIGLPTAAQPLVNMNSLMGHCVNMIPMLSNVQGQWHFEQYLSQRKQDFKTALENRHITFGTLLKHIRIDRGQSTLPLIPVTFNIDRELIGDTLLEGLSTELTINTREYSSFDMIVNISRVGETLTIECDYNSALFQHDDINELLVQYQYIINTICLSPETRISDCDLSDPLLTIQQLDSFNATVADYPKTSTVHDLILKQAQITPNATAIRFENTSITYAELINKVDCYAKGLQGAGLMPGMFAGVMLDRGPELMYTLLAIMRLGAAYIPIDPVFPEQRIQYMLTDSKTSLLVCEDRFRFICPESCQAYSTDQLMALANAESTLPVQDNLLPAYVIYTSGSTGLPKGVVMPQRALVNLLWSVKNQPGFTPKDKLLALTTISFDIAGLELYLPLISGGTLVLASSELSKDGDAIIQLIAKENITVLQATPATFRLLSGFGFKGHKNLKILCGGEPLPHELAMELLPKCHSLWNMYGPTETCIWSSAHQIKNKDTKISIGQPLANTTILILDDRHRPLPKGKIGEIAIAGDGLAHGYLNKKELSAEKFIQHPLKENESIYLSGDLGFVDSDNRLYCLGRSDNQVKVRGYRIETGEIESVILKNANYREAVVVPKLFGKDDVRLVAFVKDIGLKNRNFKLCKQTGLQLCLLEGEELEGLRSLLTKDLPDYMVPGIFMAVNAMPLTPNAKTDRKFLTDLDISAMFQSGKSTIEDPSYNNTWSETELSIKPLWETALGVKSASRLDDFFASGGHSLIAIELMHQIEQELGLKLPLSALFRKPSIAGLAQIINGETNGSGTYHYLVPVKPEGSNPPLYIVHGIGLEVMVFKDLASHMDANQPVYGVQAIGLSNNEFPPEKLEQIAAKYIQEIRAHNPKGPYLIAGHSAGSLLAYEIGRQLEKAGANIGMLAIFDYSLESTKKEISNGQKIIQYLLNFFPALLHALKMLIKYPKEAGKYYRTMIKLSINGILARFGKEIPDDDDPSREEFYKIMDAYISAFRHYEVMPFYGKVDLFRSEKKLYYLKDRKFLGWHPYAVKGVVIHEVEGDHDHMILGEYSEGFARKLQKAINRCLKMN